MPSDDRGARLLACGSPPPPLLTTIRRRVVNTKRGDMPSSLRAAFVAAAGSAYPRSAEAAVFIAHTRFATASLPAVAETHPHEWTPHSPSSCAWVFSAGRFERCVD